MCFNDLHSNRLSINTWFSYFSGHREKRRFVRGGEILRQTEGYLIIARGARELPANVSTFRLGLGFFQVFLQ